MCYAACERTDCLHLLLLVFEGLEIRSLAVTLLPGGFCVPPVNDRFPVAADRFHDI